MQVFERTGVEQKIWMEDTFNVYTDYNPYKPKLVKPKLRIKKNMNSNKTLDLDATDKFKSVKPKVHSFWK